MDVGGWGLGGRREGGGGEGGCACLGNDIWEVAKATGSRCTTAKMRAADSVRVPGSLTRAPDREVNPSGGQLSDGVQRYWATRRRTRGCDKDIQLPAWNSAVAVEPLLCRDINICIQKRNSRILTVSSLCR